ncbi:MAG: hypothetical protein ACRECR_05670, partial [Thermoplasmata archaeon]
PERLGGLAVTVRRNGYGRQRESFEAPLRLPALGETPFPGIFLRSPRIVGIGPSVTPLAFLGTEVVGVGRASIWALAFHPELSGDPRVHAAWIAGFAPEMNQPGTRAPRVRTTKKTVPTAITSA